MVKREWPHNWPNFISQICSMGKQSPAVCINHMKLLGLLSQDASENVGDLTHDKQVKLKENLNKFCCVVFILYYCIIFKLFLNYF